MNYSNFRFGAAVSEAVLTWVLFQGLSETNPSPMSVHHNGVSCSQHQGENKGLLFSRRSPPWFLRTVRTLNLIGQYWLSWDLRYLDQSHHPSWLYFRPRPKGYTVNIGYWWKGQEWPPRKPHSCTSFLPHYLVKIPLTTFFFPRGFKKKSSLSAPVT